MTTLQGLQQVWYLVQDDNTLCTFCFAGNVHDEDVKVVHKWEEAVGDISCSACHERIHRAQATLIRLYCYDAEGKLLTIQEYDGYRAPADMIDDIHEHREKHDLMGVTQSEHTFPYEVWDVDGCSTVKAVVTWLL